METWFDFSRSSVPLTGKKQVPHRLRWFGMANHKQGEAAFFHMLKLTQE
jgi:hypothetical protein